MVKVYKLQITLCNIILDCGEYVLNEMDVIGELKI